MPERIQLRRTKGWRKPEGVVVVSRPTKWGNPYKVGTLSLAEVRELYSMHLHTQISKGRLDLSEIRGRDLACWCPLDRWCHADTLLRLANS